jgi:hypothetical protein
VRLKDPYLYCTQQAIWEKRRKGFQIIENALEASNTSTPARSSDMSNFSRLTNAANVMNSSSINSNGFPVNTTAKPATANITRTSFGNPYPTGKTFPITIHGGKLVGILADENIATMILVLDPRNMTIELPRIVIAP